MSTSLKLQMGAALAALLLVSALVMRVSSAAFSDTTGTSGSWSAGSVVLNDDDGVGSLTFSNDTGMVPGNSDRACIKVTYGSTVAASVKMYGSTTFSSASDLGDHLTLTIEDVDLSGLTATCDSPTAVNATLFSAKDLSVSAGAFTVAHTSWANGLATGWSPSTSGATKTYRVTITLQDDNGAQGLNTNATFTWEAQNA